MKFTFVNTHPITGNPYEETWETMTVGELIEFLKTKDSGMPVFATWEGQVKEIQEGNSWIGPFAGKQCLVFDVER